MQQWNRIVMSAGRGAVCVCVVAAGLVVSPQTAASQKTSHPSEPMSAPAVRLTASAVPLDVTVAALIERADEFVALTEPLMGTGSTGTGSMGTGSAPSPRLGADLAGAGSLGVEIANALAWLPGLLFRALADGTLSPVTATPVIGPLIGSVAWAVSVVGLGLAYGAGAVIMAIERVVWSVVGAVGGVVGSAGAAPGDAAAGTGEAAVLSAGGAAMTGHRPEPTVASSDDPPAPIAAPVHIPADSVAPDHEAEQSSDPGMSVPGEAPDPEPTEPASEPDADQPDADEPEPTDPEPTDPEPTRPDPTDEDSDRPAQNPNRAQPAESVTDNSAAEPSRQQSSPSDEPSAAA